MMSTNFLKEKLISGKPVIGTWSIIPSTVSTDIIASTGMDFIIIDAEHGPINFETAQDMAIVCESRGVSPVMRVGGIHETDILKALDIGIHCVQIPNVATRQDVDEIVRLSKYPPLGNRGFSPFTRAGSYSLNSATTLTQTANDNTLVAINVEGKEAIENIDEIIQIEGLDILFIGLFDLSKALGIPGEVNHPDVKKHLSNLTQKINAAGKWAGTIVTKPEQISEYIDIGIKYLVYLVDCEVLRNSYSDVVEQFNGKVD